MKTIEDIKYLMVGKGLITDLADLLRANDEEFAESEKNDVHRHTFRKKTCICEAPDGR